MPYTFPSFDRLVCDPTKPEVRHDRFLAFSGEGNGMLYKSKRCDPRPKARDVPLTWARASAYRNRAIEYLKLAHLAPDRNVQKRFIAIGRRYCTLAEFERRTAAEPASYSHQSQNTVNRNHSGPFTSFAFVLMIIVSGTTTTVPFDLARASDCLAAPNSPRSEGKSLVLPPKPRNSAKVLAHALV